MIITLLTDYGRADAHVGICHGVIARIAPQVRVLDISHDVPAFDLRRGAVMLRDALPWFPVGVHIAVVDPDVGGSTRAIAVRCRDGRILIGRDNGLLCPAWERLGGAEAAYDISRSPLRLEPVSATFHGRDVFAPIAARLALGVPLEQCGVSVGVETLQRMALPVPRMTQGALIVHPLLVDEFGNVTLDATPQDATGIGLEPGASVRLETPAAHIEMPYARTFGDVTEGNPLLHEDATGRLAIAVNRGSAAAELALDAGTELRISRRA